MSEDAPHFNLISPLVFSARFLQGLQQDYCKHDVLVHGGGTYVDKMLIDIFLLKLSIKSWHTFYLFFLLI